MLKIEAKGKTKTVTFSMKEADVRDLKELAKYYEINKSELVRKMVEREKQDIKKPGNNN